MLRALLIGAALLALGESAAAQEPAVQVPVLTGKWSGYWKSDKNGHQGPLHGRFRQVDETTYRVAFHGRFWGVFPFWYSTKMQVVGTGDGFVQLSAIQRLGPMGTFSTSAMATGLSFDATFSSKNDSGRFVLSRRR